MAEVTLLARILDLLGGKTHLELEIFLTAFGITPL